ncbi:MAG: hypothetical protein AAF721_14675 [Myxococcota bacterium]
MRWRWFASVLIAGCTGSGDPNTGLSGAASGTGISGSTSAAGDDDDSGGSPGEDGTGDSGAEDSNDTASGGAADSSGGETTSAASSTTMGDGDGTDTGSGGGSEGDSSTGEPFDGVIDIGITAHNDCTFTVTPASITVPLGTEFTVNWISNANSEVEFDVAKIDPFNHVPIILGLEPGTSYHDVIREWCGDLFTGTFDFRLTSCFDPVYIPVDCGG